METLSTPKRTAILRCLVEGNSIASTCRITGAAKNTVVNLMRRAGFACADYQHRHMVELPCTELQLDEIWSFVGCKEKNREATGRHGDVWTWTALCVETKLIPVWHAGTRSLDSAMDFCSDLSGRFIGHLQITTDGLPAYRVAIGEHMSDADFAQLRKTYEKSPGGREKYVGAERIVYNGTPDRAKISTSYMERANLTLRMSNRRFTRKTNAFSKKFENHCLMMALSFMYYNYCRKHMSIGCTPVQKAGLDDREWKLLDVIDMMDKYSDRIFEEACEEAFATQNT